MLANKLYFFTENYIIYLFSLFNSTDNYCCIEKGITTEVLFKWYLSKGDFHNTGERYLFSSDTLCWCPYLSASRPVNVNPEVMLIKSLFNLSCSSGSKPGH